MIAAGKRPNGAQALLILALSLLAGACAHNDPRDPLEPLNRGIYSFNDTLDNAVLKPVATAYRDTVPQPARAVVSNFFNNINDLLNILNNLLQGKVPNAVNDAGRVAVNSTLGLLGTIDVATQLGVARSDEDFGQTLGWWGATPGPYLVIPFFGPSSLRDAIGSAVDFKLDPIWNSTGYNIAVRNGVSVVRIINKRTLLLEGKELIDQAALDPYVAVRDGYLARRRSLVYDGNPPPEKDDMDEPSQQKKPRGELEPESKVALAVPAPAADTGATVSPSPAAAVQPAAAPAPASDNGASRPAANLVPTPALLQ